jgi:hypothetical protein
MAYIPPSTSPAITNSSMEPLCGGEATWHGSPPPSIATIGRSATSRTELQSLNGLLILKMCGSFSFEQPNARRHEQRHLGTLRGSRSECDGTDMQTDNTFLGSYRFLIRHRFDMDAARLDNVGLSRCPSGTHNAVGLFSLRRWLNVPLPLGLPPVNQRERRPHYSSMAADSARRHTPIRLTSILLGHRPAAVVHLSQCA